MSQPNFFSVLPSGLNQTVDASGNLIDASGNPSVATYTGADFTKVNGTAIEMSLLSFDKTVTIDTDGIIYHQIYTPAFKDYDAIADLDVSLVNFRKIFAFGSDSIDLQNIAGAFDPTRLIDLENTRFYVYDDEIDGFQPSLGANAVVTNNAIEAGESGGVFDQHAKKDFVRYLAWLLFNTPYATSLFLNEQELVTSVSNSLNSAWDQCRVDLHNISTSGTSADLTVDVSGNYMMDVSGGNIKNICGELYRQLASRQPQRFADVKDLRVLHATEPDDIDEVNREQFYLPLIQNDTIDIKVTIHPHASQPLYGLSSTAAPAKFETDGTLKHRTYLIRMRLV
jgi:hypothetical protein